jgi:hypothetical protein
MIVFPYSRAKKLKSLQIFVAVNESSPDVGSSSKISCGFVMSSTAIDVRLRSPPEMVFFRT